MGRAGASSVEIGRAETSARGASEHDGRCLTAEGDAVREEERAQRCIWGSEIAFQGNRWMGFEGMKRSES